MCVLMKNKKSVISWLLALCLVGCNKTPVAFEMTIDTVDKLNGLLLKGVALSGTVRVGCIAEGTPFVIYRDNEKILEESVRILSVSNDGNNKPPNGEAIEKELVTLYVPNIEVQQVVAGDVMRSEAVSCRKTSLAKLK